MYDENCLNGAKRRIAAREKRTLECSSTMGGSSTILPGVPSLRSRFRPNRCFIGICKITRIGDPNECDKNCNQIKNKIDTTPAHDQKTRRSKAGASPWSSTSDPWIAPRASSRGCVPPTTGAPCASCRRQSRARRCRDCQTRRDRNYNCATPGPSSENVWPSS